MHYGDRVSEAKLIRAGVPQGSVLGPFRYLVYTANILQPSHTVSATFADDTAILTSHEQYEIATNRLQIALHTIVKWTQEWKVRLSTSKTVRVDFSLREHGYNITLINAESVPLQESVKYLGIHLDRKLIWKTHLQKKKEELNLRYRTMYWLFRARNKLTLENESLLYTTVLRPLKIRGKIIRKNKIRISNIE